MTETQGTTLMEWSLAAILRIPLFTVTTAITRKIARRLIQTLITTAYYWRTLQLVRTTGWEILQREGAVEGVAIRMSLTSISVVSASR